MSLEALKSCNFQMPRSAWGHGDSKPGSQGAVGDGGQRARRPHDNGGPLSTWSLVRLVGCSFGRLLIRSLNRSLNRSVAHSVDHLVAQSVAARATERPMVPPNWSSDKALFETPQIADAIGEGDDRRRSGRGPRRGVRGEENLSPVTSLERIVWKEESWIVGKKRTVWKEESWIVGKGE